MAYEHSFSKNMTSNLTLISPVEVVTSSASLYSIHSTTPWQGQSLWQLAVSKEMTPLPLRIVFSGTGLVKSKFTSSQIWLLE